MSRSELVDLAKNKLGEILRASDEQVLEEISDTVIDEALSIANTSESDTSLKDLKAPIVEAIVIAYQNRGSEGLKSQSELGQSNSFVDWMEYLRTAIINGGKRYLF